MAEKPFFRSAFKGQRCIIPVSGYCEWRDTPEGKQPYYFTAFDGSPALSVAGLFDTWKDKETGETLRSCTMIITPANEWISVVHDRMLALLTPDQFEPWLTGAVGLEILKPAPNDVLQRWPVSKRVNSSRTSDDDATLIERAA